MSHYDTLGVGKDATPDEVRKAYRAKASEHHPDKEGGDKDKMQMVNAAWATLGDAERRAQYDATGDDKADSIDGEAQNCAMAALMQHLEQPGALGAARRDLRQRREQMLNAKAMHTRKAERVRARRDKFKIKDGATNIAHLLIDQAVRQLEDHNRGLERELTIVDKALALLETHGEEIPTPEAPDPLNSFHKSLMDEIMGMGPRRGRIDPMSTFDPWPSPPRANPKT